MPAFFAGFFILAASVGAQPKSSVKGEVIEFGIYKAASSKTTENPDTLRTRKEKRNLNIR